MPTPLQGILAALEAAGHQPRCERGGWMSTCPAHSDRRPSLSVTEGRDGRALVHCFAGCTVEAVVDALGLRVSDLYGSPSSGTRSQAAPPSAPARVSSPAHDFSSMHQGHVRSLEAHRRAGVDHAEALAARLGVSAHALRRLGLGWCSDRYGGCVSFPMSDAGGAIVGLRLRLGSGGYRSIKGSRAGLFVPAGMPNCVETLVVVEGATSAAAGLTLGYHVIGLPSATARPEQLLGQLRRLGMPRVVLIVDQDEAGQKCAATVLRAVRGAGGPAVSVSPPARDLRDWLIGGATRADVDALIQCRHGGDPDARAAS